MMRVAAIGLALALAGCSARHLRGEADAREEGDAGGEASDPVHEDGTIGPDADAVEEPDMATDGPDVVDGASEPEGDCDISSREAGCMSSGGTVSWDMCCASAWDFPDECGTGACGCADEESHNVSVCECGEGRCFDGACCVDAD